MADDDSVGGQSARLLDLLQKQAATIARYQDREHRFAALMGVPDSWRYENDWIAKAEVHAQKDAQIKALKDEANRLDEEIAAWQENSGLEGAEGDPARVTPAHLADDLRKREREAAEKDAQIKDLADALYEIGKQCAAAGAALRAVGRIP